MLYDTGSSNSVLCDNLEGWDGWEVGRRLKREGTYIYLWLIHADIWQKPTQHSKAIVPQLKIKDKTKKENLHHILTFLSLPFICLTSICWVHITC